MTELREYMDVVTSVETGAKAATKLKKKSAVARYGNSPKPIQIGDSVSLAKQPGTNIGKVARIVENREVWIDSSGIDYEKINGMILEHGLHASDTYIIARPDEIVKLSDRKRKPAGKVKEKLAENTAPVEAANNDDDWMKELKNPAILKNDSMTFEQFNNLFSLNSFDNNRSY